MLLVRLLLQRISGGYQRLLKLQNRCTMMARVVAAFIEAYSVPGVQGGYPSEAESNQLSEDSTPFSGVLIHLSV
jgi:hypothetical protein